MAVDRAGMVRGRQSTGRALSVATVGRDRPRVGAGGRRGGARLAKSASASTIAAACEYRHPGAAPANRDHPGRPRSPDRGGKIDSAAELA